MESRTGMSVLLVVERGISFLDERGQAFFRILCGVREAKQVGFEVTAL